MKTLTEKRLILTLALTAALTAGAKDKVVKQPAYAEGSPSLISVSVTLSKTATAITFRRGGGGWSVPEDAHLAADGKTYRMTGGTVYTKQEDGTHDAGEPFVPGKDYARANDSIQLVFEPLDPGTKIVDVIADEKGSSFNIQGLRLDGKLYPFLLDKPKPYPYAKDEPLPALTPQYGRAKYTVSVRNLDGTTKIPLLGGMNNKFSADQYNDFDRETISYQIEASSTYTAAVGVPDGGNQFRLLMIPGYETKILADVAALNTALSGNNKIPGERTIQFEGPIADLQQVRYDERYLYSALQSQTADELWTKMQDRIRSYEQNKAYSRRQKEFARLNVENFYLRHYLNFVRQGKADMQDAHAPELQLLRDGRSFYLIGEDDYLGYAHANGIGGVVTEWMEGYRRAMNMAKRMRDLELMPESAFDTIPSLFQTELRAMNDSTRVITERLRNTASEVRVMDTPNCSGKEFIDHVVSENPGVVLFFDLWATWCGPCMRGIQAMEPLKAELAGRPIRFVYVTNESSPVNQWSQQMTTMHGLHYRLPDDIWNEIPNLDAIPQYYIYDREGNLFYEQMGFDTVDPLREKINEALTK